MHHHHTVFSNQFVFDSILLLLLLLLLAFVIIICYIDLCVITSFLLANNTLMLIRIHCKSTTTHLSIHSSQVHGQCNVARSLVPFQSLLILSIIVSRSNKKIYTLITIITLSTNHSSSADVMMSLDEFAIPN